MFGLCSGCVQAVHRLCSGCHSCVQAAYRLCSGCLSQLCSGCVQVVFRLSQLCSGCVQAVFRLSVTAVFRLCTCCVRAVFRLCSGCLSQQCSGCIQNTPVALLVTHCDWPAVNCRFSRMQSVAHRGPEVRSSRAVQCRTVYPSARPDLRRSGYSTECNA